MKGSCTKPVLFTFAILVFLIIVQENRVAAAAVAPCDPTQLSPCVDAIERGSTPSDLCCTRVKQQQHCVCQYLKNPDFKSFIDSPKAKKIATYCHCPYPKC